MNKHQIAQALDVMAAILEINGENPFKVRAYQNAARIVEGLNGDIASLIATGELREVKGIGAQLAKHIQELCESGSFEEYETLRTSLPVGLLDLLKIPGLGAKKVRVLWKKLDITTIEALKQACIDGHVAALERFGERTQQKILQGIESVKKYEGRYLFPKVEAQALRLRDALKSHSDVIRCEIAGSLRRRMEIVKDIDLVASTKHPATVADFFASLPEADALVGKGDTKVTITTATGVNADLRIVTDEQFPYALHHFTGSKEHNVAMRSRAKEHDLKMNEYGLFRGSDEINIPCKDEAEIFKVLGLDFIPPELRQDMGEIEAAENHALPKLVEEIDLQGTLHMHSTYSDGRGTIEEMALAAAALGWSYIGITDHSKSAGYAGGMQLTTIARQHAEIDELNRKLKGMRIFKGVEVDILADGSLDYDDDTLRLFDFVIASIHSQFTMPEAEMTARICKALRHPLVDILAHPTGRLLLSREPYAVNLPTVIEAAAKHRVAIEINGHPQRLDLDWRLGRLAKEKGVKTVLTSDAHSPDQLMNVRYSLNIARKGWWEKSDVLNCLSADDLSAYFAKRRL
ncbi:MAG: DNA polymerase/3'-5' exonuclease PolX [Deltaproteobacteria bacterium]|nr:DNA polymerase/3'-5' exonuclease PolX [Deltaproteobacteria bacterium]